MREAFVFGLLLFSLLLEVFFAQFPFVLVASLYFGWRNPSVFVFLMILVFGVVLDVLRVSPLGLSGLIAFGCLLVLHASKMVFEGRSRVAWLVVSVGGVFVYVHVVEYFTNPFMFVLVFGIVAVAVFSNKRSRVDDSLAFYKVWR